MKKQFIIKESNKAPARQVDAFKHEIKKYIARERRKDLPEGGDYWDFSCRFGLAEGSLKEIHVSEINKAIDAVIAQGEQAFYLEIKAIAKTRK